MLRKFFLLIIAFPSLLFGQDLKIENETLFYDGGDPSKTGSTLYLTEDMLRSDSEGKDHKSSTIYKVEEEALYVLDHADKSYRKIDREQIEEMQKQMERMRERLEQMPEEQKEQMKEMMGSKLEKKGNVKYEGTGDSKKIEPWGECDEYVGKREERTVQRVYTIDRNNLELGEAHFDVLRSMIDFISFLPEGMKKHFPVSEGSEQEDRNGLEGFGVQWTYFDSNGKKTHELRTKEVNNTELKDSLFEVPEDYQLIEGGSKTRMDR